MRRGRARKKRARRTATASLPLWARIPRFYIWNNELERAKDAICERPLNLYVCRRGALWLAYHRTQTQSATQWEFVFNPSTDIDSDYSYDTRTRQKCFIRTGYSFQPSIRLNSSTSSHRVCFWGKGRVRPKEGGVSGPAAGFLICFRRWTGQLSDTGPCLLS